jgi:hypothetical protein
MNTTTNSGKLILPFAIVVLFLNITILVFLFLIEGGFIKVSVFDQFENDTEEVISYPVSYSN